MSIATSPERVEIVARRRPFTVVALAVLLGLLSIGALQGGIAMVVDPLAPLGMSVDYLERTPIDDYFLPGLFLLGIAAASLLAIPGLLFSWEWRWASKIESRVGYKWPWVAVVATGGILLLFELIELFVVPFHPIMHPLLIAVSLAILGLAFTPSTRRYLSAAQPNLTD